MATAPEYNVNMMTKELITIREMCDRYDVTPRTLRFYEAKELLYPQRVGQKRLYSARDRARLKLILRAKRFGFSLDDIRELLDLYDIGDQQWTQYNAVYKACKTRLSEMIAQRDELNEAIEELKEQLAWGEKVLASMQKPDS